MDEKLSEQKLDALFLQTAHSTGIEPPSALRKKLMKVARAHAGGEKSSLIGAAFLWLAASLAAAASLWLARSLVVSWAGMAIARLLPEASFRLVNGLQAIHIGWVAAVGAVVFLVASGGLDDIVAL